MFIRGLRVSARYAHQMAQGNRIPREGLHPVFGQTAAFPMAGSLIDRCATPSAGAIIDVEG